MYAGFISILLLLVAIGTGIMVTTSMGSEAPIKKRKKLQEAQQTTSTYCIVCFVTTFLGVFLWIGVSEMAFKALRASAFIPWPAWHAGACMGVANVLITFIGTIAGVKRVKKDDDEAEEGDDDKEEYADGGVPAMPGLDDPMMMGPPPMGGPYDPAMGPPMDGPPMGPPMGPPFGPPMGGPPPPGGF